MFKFKTLKLSELNPASYNPRISLQPGDATYEKLKASMNRFGCVEPLVWNQRTGNLVGGHQRLSVLKNEGVEKVRVSVVDLSLEDEKALNLALNKIQGDWDEDKLAQLLTELTSDPDFDLDITGFELGEVQSLLDGIGIEEDRIDAIEDDFDADKTANEIKDPITQSGDIIELGPNRLICGDSSKAETWARLLESKKIDLIFTDPPYNVNYYGGNRPSPSKARPKQSRQWSKIYCDNLTQDEYEDWLALILYNVTARFADGTPFYIWNGHRQFGPMYSILSRAGLKISCVITWAKPNFAIGYGDYNQQTEFCLYGWREDGGKHRWYGPTNESTLWEASRECTKDYKHPTQKPLTLPVRAIQNSSRKGDLVVDAFLGSGSTLIASQQTGRICCGVEIAPHYCDAIVIRYGRMFGWESVPDAYRSKYEGTVEEVNHVN
jgi:DNA modification methylase